jgi:hypothetical protein
MGRNVTYIKKVKRSKRYLKRRKEREKAARKEAQKKK